MFCFCNGSLAQVLEARSAEISTFGSPGGAADAKLRGKDGAREVPSSTAAHRLGGRPDSTRLAARTERRMVRGAPRPARNPARPVRRRRTPTKPDQGDDPKRAHYRSHHKFSNSGLGHEGLPDAWAYYIKRHARRGSSCAMAKEARRFSAGLHGLFATSTSRWAGSTASRFPPIAREVSRATRFEPRAVHRQTQEILDRDVDSWTTLFRLTPLRFR